jgi:cation diffusion facilitator family transporter
MMNRPSLTKFAWLSIAAAVVTILLKLAAYWATDSVGLLSDAMEGGINLVAAGVALIALKIVEQPPDEAHTYGHDKAEYFSSGIEGTLIGVASLGIIYTAVQRLLAPQPLEQVGLGLTLAVGASAINLIVGQIQIRTGKKYDSITLEADGHHLMADVWTSIGVVVGVSLAVLTGLIWLDAVVALLVGAKIGWDGLRIFIRSTQGLMDSAISPEERDRVEAVLRRYESVGLQWHALRTRQSGARRFISLHLLVPGAWTVQQAHDFSEHIEAEIRQRINHVTVTTHLEPVDDPVSMNDAALDRASAGEISAVL